MKEIANYIRATNDLIEAFEKKHDCFLDFESGHYYHFLDYYAFTIEDIIRDLQDSDNNAYEWFTYILDNDKKINFQSYLMGLR
jgi:hypothetical protein